MDDLWAGYPAHLKKFQENMLKADARISELRAGSTDDEEDWLKPESLYSRQGSVGVVKIEGSLIKGEANAIYQMFGYQGYDNIKAALVEAVMDKEAESIMLYVDSGGGSVAGVRDAAQFIKTVGSVKPIYAFAEFAASAAYWLASSTGHIITPETGITGSIGVLRVHTEYSKAEEKDGYTTTVMRAGKFKALMNPHEPLSEDAKAQSQAMLEDIYAMFVSDVAENLGTTYVNVDMNMAQGKEFLGLRAKSAGLVHAVGNLDYALVHGTKIKSGSGSQLNKYVSAAIDNKSNSAHNADVNGNTGPDMEHNLTKEQLEALASGVPLEAVTGEQTPVEASISAGVEEEVAAAIADTAALASAQVEIEGLKAAVAAETSKLEAMQAEAKSLRAIVEASVTQMNVALNRTVDLSAMTNIEVVAAYATSKADLSTAYRAGGVAKPAASVQADTKSAGAARADAEFLRQARSFNF